jgi:hypothetical protein
MLQSSWRNQNLNLTDSNPSKNADSNPDKIFDELASAAFAPASDKDQNLKIRTIHQPTVSFHDLYTISPSRLKQDSLTPINTKSTEATCNI